MKYKEEHREICIDHHWETEEYINYILNNKEEYLELFKNDPIPLERLKRKIKKWEDIINGRSIK